MMVSKVGTHGEIMRLEFKCRLLCRGKYRLLPIKDNETLSNVLELPHKLGPDYFLEIYMEKESNFGGTEMPIPSYNQLNASQNVDGYYSAGAGPSAPTTYNPMVLTTPYPHWNEECPPICNVQHTTETTVQNYASSDDTVPLFDELGVSDEDSVEDVDGAWKGADNDSGDDEVGGHHDMQEVHKNLHIPFYHNLHFDNDVPHQCVYPRMNRDNCNLKSEVIAHFIKAQIAISPELPLATIIEVVNEKFQFTISYKKAWLARTKAVAMVFGDWDESYRRLPRYMAALQAFNPGIVVMWDMILNLHSTSIGTEMYMNYVFWAFKPAIEGFKYCRPVICIDSTHLYGKYEGKIVAATAVTVADKIVPLAFAVVDKEMIES
ncbi:hypothetical protein CsSME_00040974 [Camellia sinensis var. sinensis]